MSGQPVNSRLSRAVLSPGPYEKWDRLQTAPVTVLQIGEGNFLRGFFDWMIQECRDQGFFQGGIAVTQPRPGGGPKLKALKDQDGLYTLVIRGVEKGARVERKQTVSVFASMIDPYKEWETFLKLAESPELEFVVSNTTEAGLAYRPVPFVEGEPIVPFPGKMALFLYRRFLAFGGSPDKGLVFLPCELVDGNGDVLRSCVVKHAEDWGLPRPFIEWVARHNRFLNSLVDRIVTGYPEAEAERWFEEWGYRDELLTTAEPYHLWAIEAGPDMEERLPLQRSGLNVQWVSDLTPYRLRKVRMLNGAHTLLAPLGILQGYRHVREAFEAPGFGASIRRALEEEVIPSIPLPASELHPYAEALYERLLNPYIDHRLSDIALNSTSKFKVRVLPSLRHYAENGKPLPGLIVRSLAALLRFYKVEEKEDGAYRGLSFAGESYTVRDDPAVLAAFEAIWKEHDARSRLETARLLLGLEEVWGADLAAIPGLGEAVASWWEELEQQ